MNSIFHKILSIFLIPILLFSTTSFSVFKHECGNQVFSISITGDNDACDMDMNTIEESCELISVKDFIDTENKDCCKSNVKFVSGSQSNLDRGIQLTNLQLNVVCAYTLTYLNLFRTELTPVENNKYYTPPIRVKDIPVFYQVFLI